MTRVGINIFIVKSLSGLATRRFTKRGCYATSRVWSEFRINQHFLIERNDVAF